MYTYGTDLHHEAMATIEAIELAMRYAPDGVQDAAVCMRDKLKEQVIASDEAGEIGG